MGRFPQMVNVSSIGFYGNFSRRNRRVAQIPKERSLLMRNCACSQRFRNLTLWGGDPPMEWVEQAFNAGRLYWRAFFCFRRAYL